MTETEGADEVIDAVDRHLDAAGSVDRAAGPLGVYLAWCANLGLLSESFSRGAETDLVRVRMRDMMPGEFLVKAGAGALRAADLTTEGLEFTRRCYPGYVEAYAAALEVPPGAIYKVADSWENYDRVAPELTRQLYGRRHMHAERTASRLAEGLVKRLADWWRGR